MELCWGDGHGGRVKEEMCVTHSIPIKAVPELEREGS